jgi:hypothetical protein
MLSIRDEASLTRALELPIDHRIKRLLRKRRTQLGYEFGLTELAHFVVVQPRDTLEALEQVLSFSVFQNPVDGSHFGEPYFSPGWEWIEDHGFCFEFVFIMDDSGFGHVVIVPKEQGIGPELLKLCRRYASEHA